MERSTLDQLRRHFADVATMIGQRLSAANPHVVALVAKWDKADLVPGLSDMDFRVICDDATAVDDWVEIDWCTGRLHLEMVRANSQWNRINEHTAGAGLTIAEAFHDRAITPEQAHWSLWWGRGDWFERLKAQVASQPFAASDEHYHLSKFLHYYSPYIHGIDPPVNLGPFEPKYALHSRCWHYFAPPMLSAAALLARKNLSGKRAGLSWLREHGYAAAQVDAVFHQIDAHYETPEQTDPARLEAFEKLLFAGFEELLPRVVDAIEHLNIDRSARPAELKQQLAAGSTDAMAVLLENVRSTRIRAGRYDFLANAPDHFDARPLVYNELPWMKEFCVPVLASLRTLLGEAGLSPQQCLHRLGIPVNGAEERAIRHAWDLAGRSRDDQDIPRLFSQAIDWFPHYYRLIEAAAARIVRM
jgi:hypothetical protein